MKYYDTLSDAHRKISKIRALLDQHDLPCNPINYSVAYEYFSNGNPELKQKLSNAINNQQVEAYLFECLFDEFLQKHQAIHDHNIKQLGETMHNLHSVCNSSADSVKSLSSNVHNALEDLKDSNNSETITLLRSIEQATQVIQKKQQMLEDVVAQAEKQTLSIQEELEEAKLDAVTDPLTSLLNRKGLTQFFNLWKKEQSNGVISAVVLDIDHFKSFNDTFGHLIGDVILRRLAQKLQESVYKTGHAFRFGGEEFLLLFPAKSIKDTADLADTIRQNVATMRFVNAKTKQKLPSLTISLGVAQWGKGEELEELISRADKALYQAKNGGRDQVKVCESDA